MKTKMNKSTLLVISIILLLLVVVRTSSAQEATEEGDLIREKVREKIEKALANPKAYIGTVTDITNETLQIKDSQEEIKQISINEEEVTFMVVGKASKQATYDDVAIGDFIVSMGFLSNGNEVLEAKRILITSPLTTPTRRIVFGTIAEIDKKTVNLVTKEQEEITLKFPKRWKGPEIEELEEGTKVIAVYLIEDEENIIRTIEIVSESESEPSPTPEDVQE